MDIPDATIPSLFNVKGKIAVVTGGGSGIGTMIASAFVQNGAKVYIVSRKEAQLKNVCDVLNKKGPGSCHYIVGDLGSKAGCDKVTEEIKKKEQKIHILVNNSGASWGAPYDNFPEQQGWDKILALNVKSIFYMTQGLTNLLEKDSTNRDPGRVINISSIAAFETRALGSSIAAKDNGLWSYNTSKAAVNHLTKNLATTLAPRLITVNAICPGVFPSKMTAWGLKQQGDSAAKYQPMGRLGDARDMAGVALFLVSPASAHVTGDYITVDGGSLIDGRSRL